jgi:NADP-dependent 3-hydroxy acid dehydrogenase YdfG
VRSKEGVSRFGRIDTLINNAGIFIAKPFTQYTEDDYKVATVQISSMLYSPQGTVLAQRLTTPLQIEH